MKIAKVRGGVHRRINLRKSTAGHSFELVTLDGYTILIGWNENGKHTRRREQMIIFTMEECHINIMVF